MADFLEPAARHAQLGAGASGADGGSAVAVRRARSTKQQFIEAHYARRRPSFYVPLCRQAAPVCAASGVPQARRGSRRRAEKSLSPARSGRCSSISGVASPWRRRVDCATEGQRSLRAELVGVRRPSATLAETVPRISAAYALLLSAEISASKRGATRPTCSATTRSAVCARRPTTVQHEALANELCARIWLQRGRRSRQRVPVTGPIRCYAAGARRRRPRLRGRYSEPARGEQRDVRAGDRSGRSADGDRVGRCGRSTWPLYSRSREPSPSRSSSTICCAS